MNNHHLPDPALSTRPLKSITITTDPAHPSTCLLNEPFHKPDPSPPRKETVGSWAPIHALMLQGRKEAEEKGNQCTE